LRAEIKRTACHVETADGNAHDGRLAGIQDKAQRAKHARLIVAAMLHVERHGVESAMGENFDRQGFRKRGPCGKHCFPGAKARRQRHSNFLHFKASGRKCWWIEFYVRYSSAIKPLAALRPETCINPASPGGLPLRGKQTSSRG